LAISKQAAQKFDVGKFYLRKVIELEIKELTVSDLKQLSRI